MLQPEGFLYLFQTQKSTESTEVLKSKVTDL